MNFNEKLMELRRSKGMSQEQLGNELDVTRQTVSKWELGLTTPEMNKLIEISKLFDISIDELVGNDNGNINKQTQTTIIQSKPFSEKFHYEYKSSKTIRNIPLIHINIGLKMHRAKGIIAIGNIATGVLSLGFISVGIVSFGLLALGLLISFGVMSLGILSFGAFACGIIAFGAVALGYISVGALSVGVYSIGACAIASDIAIGGYASGQIAIGDVVKGDFEFITNNSFMDINSDEVLAVINQHLPHTPDFIKNILIAITK